jgi:CubicO group peptidase (beta-lactamase class C family)
VIHRNSAGFRLVINLLLVLLAPVSGLADKIDDYLTAQMRKNHIPGLAVAVVRDAKIIKIKGYGMANLEWQAPVTPDTAFQIASSTKPLTGTALMILVEEGKLSLDDEISKYLTDAPAAWQNITVRHLATHASGLSNAVNAKPDATTEEYVKAAYAVPLVYVPGEKSAYGFTDFVVLTHLIEKVSQQSYPDFLKTKLLARLGMNDTRFDFAAEDGPVRSAGVVKKRAAVYRWENDDYRSYWFFYRVRGYSAGGIFSTVEDLAKFAAAFDEGRLLSKKSLEQMWSRDKLADGSLNGFGVGWVVGTHGGRRTVGHSGGPALADIVRFPDDRLSVVVLLNGQRVYPYLAKGVADFYLPPAPPAAEVKGVADERAELTNLVERVIADGMRDKLDETLFTEPSQKDFVPRFRNFGLPFFVSLEGPGSLVLTEHREKETGVLRRYRGLHGRKAVNWTFEFDKNNKIIYFDPRPE